MREKLKEIKNQRKKFRGIIAGFGTKRGWKGRVLKTILLRDVRNENGDIVTDHLWFNWTRGFEMEAIKEGDKVEFEGRVKSYAKGYLGRRGDVCKPLDTDYKIYNPTKINNITKFGEAKE